MVFPFLLEFMGYKDDNDIIKIFKLNELQLGSLIINAMSKIIGDNDTLIFKPNTFSYSNNTILYN